MRIFEYIILNVLSDKLVGAVIEKREDKPVVTCRITRSYSGFYDGSFLEERELREELETMLSELKKQAKSSVKSVLLGVPGEFTTVVVKNVKTEFSTMRRVTNRDVEFLLRADTLSKTSSDYLTINASPVSYTTDGATGLATAVGEMTSKLICKVSFVLAEKQFTKLFDTIAEDNRLEFIYTSAILAEIMYNLSEEERDGVGAGAIFVDIGYVSSTVTVTEGDGILYSVTFPEGEGSVAAELNSTLNIPFEHALELVQKLNFNLEYTAEDCFVVSAEGKLFRYRMDEVLETAYVALTKITAYISEALSRANLPLPSNSEPVYCTGCHMLSAEGVAGLFENALSRPIKIVKSSSVDFNTPELTSFAGLVEVAVRSENKTIKNKINIFLTRA